MDRLSSHRETIFTAWHQIFWFRQLWLFAVQQKRWVAADSSQDIRRWFKREEPASEVLAPSQRSLPGSRVRVAQFPSDLRFPVSTKSQPWNHTKLNEITRTCDRILNIPDPLCKWSGFANATSFETFPSRILPSCFRASTMRGTALEWIITKGKFVGISTMMNFWSESSAIK